RGRRARRPHRGAARRAHRADRGAGHAGARARHRIRPAAARADARGDRVALVVSTHRWLTGARHLLRPASQRALTMLPLVASLAWAQRPTAPAPAARPVVVASKPFGESYLLAEMFA